MSDQSGFELSCALIDDVISFIEDNTCPNNRNYADECLRNLERIRKINNGIREWGNEQWVLLHEAKKEIDQLEKHY